MANFNLISNPTFSIQDFRKELSAVEREGMRSIINDALKKITGEPDFLFYMGDFFTNYGYMDECHRILNIQDNEFYLGGSHQLSHFKLTNDHTIIAVCYDEGSDEILYSVE